jgi:hypothetical protein
LISRIARRTMSSFDDVRPEDARVGDGSPSRGGRSVGREELREVAMFAHLGRTIGSALFALALLPTTAALADVFPDSSERFVAREETRGLGCNDLWYARNEIFARNGFLFETARGRAAFGGDGWTRNPRLNRFERANVDLFEGLEYRRGCR